MLLRPNLLFFARSSLRQLPVLRLPCRPLVSLSTMAAPHKLLMVPGPIEFDEQVLAAMATPGTSHVDPGFIEQFGQSLEMLRKVFFCKAGQPFIISGSGTLGWDLVAANLVEDKEPVLVVSTGLFGDRFAECFTAYRAQVTTLKSALGSLPSTEDFVKALTAGPKLKAVALTHVDTSTGVLVPLPAWTALIRKHQPEALIIVDGVCSVGAEDLDMDGWGIDVAHTASQKALGVPPGLCVAVLSERALQTVKARTSPVSSYYASVPKWLPIMAAYEARKGSYFATPPVQLIMALQVSLSQMTRDGDKGLKKRFAKHVATSKLVKDTVVSWGLELVPKSRDIAANTLTAMYYPKGVKGPELLKAVTGYGVILAGGVHPDFAAKYFRIGHMHISSTEEATRHHVSQTLEALKKALTDCGHKFP